MLTALLDSTCTSLNGVSGQVESHTINPIRCSQYISVQHNGNTLGIIPSEQYGPSFAT